VYESADDHVKVSLLPCCWSVPLTCHVKVYGSAPPEALPTNVHAKFGGTVLGPEIVTVRGGGGGSYFKVTLLDVDVTPNAHAGLGLGV
jgi:hypothetical protein